MPWFILALISATASSAQTVVTKKVLINEHALEYTSALAIVNALLSLPFFLFINYAALELLHLAILGVSSFTLSAGLLFLARAVKHMEISIVAPLLVMGPGLTTLLGFLFLGEAITLLQLGGIALLLAGAYILETHHGKSLLEPLQEIKRSKYIHYVFATIIFFSVTILIDRYLLGTLNFEPVAWMAFGHVYIAVIFIAAVILLPYHNLGHIVHGFRTGGPLIIASSVLTIIYRFTLLEALALAFAGLVFTIKRVETLFVTLIGGSLFHEKNLVRKTVATFIMLIGVLSIVL